MHCVRVPLTRMDYGYATRGIVGNPPVVRWVMWSILAYMTALTLDQMLETEALFYRVARTGLDDALKQDLTQVVVSSFGDEYERAQDLLRPMMMLDDHCRAAQGMLCRALRFKIIGEHGGKTLVVGAHAVMSGIDPDAVSVIGRRVQMMLASVHAYLHERPQQAWEIVQPCTTADRVIVLGFTAVLLRKAMTGGLGLESVSSDGSDQ